jgi:MoaA/NifB/PqqE/SkfB family radical SAM enzyme
LGRNIGIERLSLLGGEPSLHPNLPSIIKGAKAIGYEHISITTNGVMSKARLYEILSSGISNISFSIDGSFPALHDSLRPSPNGKSTFHITLQNMECALAYTGIFRHDVRVNHTIYAINIKDIENMVRLVSGKGVTKVRIHFSMPDDIQIAPRNNIKPQQWLVLYAHMKRLEAKLGIEISIQPVYGLEAIAQAKFRKSPYMHIQPDGNLILCATYARMRNPDNRSFAYLEDDQRIRLNPRFRILEETDAPCCQGVTALIRQMPKEMREEVSKYGMGCIILQSPIEKRG